MERIVKGIWIPIEIWQATDLSWNEKVLLMEVDSFTQKGKDCYISNRYIADMFGVSEVTASKYLTHLINAGYVKLVKFDGRARYVESALQSFKGSLKENFKADLKKTLRQDLSELKDTYIINLNKRTDNKEIYKERKPSFNFRQSLIDAGVSPETADAWLAVRKAKRAVNTEIAWNSTLNEIRKSGQSAEACIREAVARSWAGFKAEWLQREQAGGAPSRPRKVDNVTYMVEQHQQWLAEQEAMRQNYNPQDDLPDEQ